MVMAYDPRRKYPLPGQTLAEQYGVRAGGTTQIPGGQQQVLAAPQTQSDPYNLWSDPRYNPSQPQTAPTQPLSIPQQWTQNYDPRTQPGGVFPAPAGGTDDGRINRRVTPQQGKSPYSITNPPRSAGGGPAPAPANMQGGVPANQAYKAPTPAPPTLMSFYDWMKGKNMDPSSMSTGARSEARRAYDQWAGEQNKAWQSQQQQPQLYGPGGTPLAGGGTPGGTGGGGTPATASGGGGMPGQGNTGYPQTTQNNLGQTVSDLLRNASGQALTGTPGEMQQVSRLAPSQEKIMGTTASTYEPWIGISPQAPVGPTADQQQITGPILQNLLSQLYGQQGLTGQATAALQPGLSGESAYGMTPGVAENWYQQSVENPIMQGGGTWDKLLASVNEGHAGPGYFSRSTQKDKLDAASQTQQYLAGEKAKYGWMGEQMGFEGAESAANRQLQASQAATATPGKIWGSLASAYGLATLPQEQQQKIQDTLNQITDPQVLSVISMLLGVPATQNIQIPATPSIMDSLGQLAMAGGSGLNLNQLFGGYY